VASPRHTPPSGPAAARAQSDAAGMHGGSNASARNLIQINVALASKGFAVIATVPVVRAVALMKVTS